MRHGSYGGWDNYGLERMMGGDMTAKDEAIGICQGCGKENTWTMLLKGKYCWCADCWIAAMQWATKGAREAGMIQKKEET